MLAISAFTLEALAVIVTGCVSVLLFAMIITNPARKATDQKLMLSLCALSLASVVVIGSATWARAFFAH
jgi:hypothetical protein